VSTTGAVISDELVAVSAVVPDAAAPHEVPIPALATERLGGLLGSDRLAQFRGTADRLAESLGGGTLWNINSTAAGGGVAEVLWALLPWVNVRSGAIP
jgi:hypothetical protein